MKNEKQNKFVYLRQISPYLRQYKWLFLLGLGAMLLTSGLRLLDPLIIAHIIDVSIPQKNMPDMLKYGAYFIAVIILSGLISYFQIVFLSRLGIRIITSFKSDVFRHLLKLPLSWYNTQPVGELIARVENDSERVKSLFSDLSIMILGSFIFLIGVFVVLIIRESRITLMMTIPMAVIIVSYYFIIKYISKFYKRIRELYAEITAKITDYVQGMSVIQLFNKQKKTIETLAKVSAAKKNLEAKVSFVEYGLQGVFLFIFNVLFIIFIIRISAPKIITGIITIGTLFVFMQYINKLIWPLMHISENVMAMQRSFVSLKRIIDLTSLTTEERILPGDAIPQFDKEIRFENVWFAYNDEDWVLQDVSFTIPKGSRIALVGASGSGKTTVVSLLCGFYSIARGNILIDGKPISEIRIKSWRSKIGLILQDIFLFPGNVLENIRIYNDEISQEKVSQALDIVQLSEFVATQDKGLQTELAERGQNISQGEKQLISFARALAFEPELIIMDEATASIDTRTEALIQDAIQKVLQNKTAVIIAHRLSSVLDADRILFFQNGRITHRGTHQELLSVCEDYRRLVELQLLHLQPKENNLKGDG